MYSVFMLANACPSVQRSSCAILSTINPQTFTVSLLLQRHHLAKYNHVLVTSYKVCVIVCELIVESITQFDL